MGKTNADQSGAQTRQQTMVIAGLAALLLFLLGMLLGNLIGSANAEAAEPTTTVIPTTSPPETTTTTTTGPPPELQAAVDYFVASQETCRVYAEGVGETPPDPDRYVGVNAMRMVSAKQVLIRDGLGDHFIVDLSVDPAIIYSEDGPDEMLPFDLSFGCPPGIYVGTSH